jgi:hypothetical protein
MRVGKITRVYSTKTLTSVLFFSEEERAELPRQREDTTSN